MEQVNEINQVKSHLAKLEAGLKQTIALTHSQCTELKHLVGPSLREQSSVQSEHSRPPIHTDTLRADTTEMSYVKEEFRLFNQKLLKLETDVQGVSDLIRKKFAEVKRLIINKNMTTIVTNHVEMNDSTATSKYDASPVTVNGDCNRE